MNPKQPEDGASFQYTSLEISGFGLFAQADGRTGLEAWRIIRRRHPWVAWAGAAYFAALLILIAVLGVTSLQ